VTVKQLRRLTRSPEYSGIANEYLREKTRQLAGKDQIKGDSNEPSQNGHRTCASSHPWLLI